MVEMSKKSVQSGESGLNRWKSKYTIYAMQKKHQNTRFQTTAGPQHRDKQWEKRGRTRGK